MNFNKNERNSSTYSILKIVIPLIISSLSANLMFLIDRAILAYFSIDSMNAAMLGGNLASIYTLLLMSITGTTEIFVGQYNGSQRYDVIAAPIWQMLYFVAISLMFFLPIGYFTEYLNLIPTCYASEGIAYQRLLTYFGWLPGLTAAFTGFFVGRGQTKIITFIVIVGSVVNALLAYLFVFGYKDIIPSMGCKGAALATIIAESVQVIILAIEFWNKNNRKSFGTAKNKKFDKKLLNRCIRVGLPLALGRCIDLFAWYLVYAALSHVSKELATVQGIAITVYVLFEFICDGISKGAAAISANFIGQKNLLAIRATMRKLIIITLGLCLATAAPILLSPSIIFRLLGSLHDNITPLYPTIAIIFKIIFFNITMEATCSVLFGILLSGGDAKYPNIANLTCLWGFVVLPVITLWALGHLHSVIIVHALASIWVVSFFVSLLKRYKSLKWYKSLVH